MSETPKSSFARSALRVLGALLIVPLAVSLAGLWYYCVDSKHSTPASIGDGRILELTPPAAHDITLDRDFLDHYAIYTVTERELTAFLNRTFEVEDSFSERQNIAEIKVGKAIRVANTMLKALNAKVKVIKSIMALVKAIKAMLFKHEDSICSFVYDIR